MELGGAAPWHVDFARLTPPDGDSRSPIERAVERGVRTSCVGEALSVPLLAGSMRSAAHPLTAAVLERIVQDEAPHARLGWLLLEWGDRFLDDDARRRLGVVAERAIRAYQPTWTGIDSRADGERTSEGFLLSHVHALGWMEAQAYAEAARRAVREEIVEPLARFGIHVDL